MGSNHGYDIVIVSYKYLRRLIMTSRNWLVTLSVSLYTLFFVIAFWSALPAAVTGNVAGTSSLIEPLIAACTFEEGTAGGPISQSSAREQVPRFGGETYMGWISPGYESVYHCALQTGAMFN